MARMILIGKAGTVSIDAELRVLLLLLPLVALRTSAAYLRIG